VAPISLTSIHPAINWKNTHERNGCHAPLIGTSVTLRLSGTVIRCIRRDDYSVSANTCRAAWIVYTLKLAHYFSQRKKPIIMFCSFSSALPQIYMPYCVDPDFTMQQPLVVLMKTF